MHGPSVQQKAEDNAHARLERIETNQKARLFGFLSVTSQVMSQAGLALALKHSFLHDMQMDHAR